MLKEIGNAWTAISTDTFTHNVQLKKKVIEEDGEDGDEVYNDDGLWFLVV